MIDTQITVSGETHAQYTLFTIQTKPLLTYIDWLDFDRIGRYTPYRPILIANGRILIVPIQANQIKVQGSN